MRVFVYKNLHKGCFSVKSLEGEDKGRVIAHARAVLLQDACFKVSEAGRQRVLKERRKNVHAGVVGQLSLMVALDEPPDRTLTPPPRCVLVTYNPYRYRTFVTDGTEIPVQHAASAYLADGRVYVCTPWG
ncbi:hypothetical protein [Thioalkalivibrio thiocyanodenitrificans]